MDVVPTQPLVKSSLVEAAHHPATRRQKRAQRLIRADAVERVQVTAAHVAIAQASADMKMSAVDQTIARAKLMAVNAAQNDMRLVELAPSAAAEIGDLSTLNQIARRQVVSQLVDDLGA